MMDQNERSEHIFLLHNWAICVYYKIGYILIICRAAYSSQGGEQFLMNRREQLEENYADSLFTLLMDHVAEVQGKQALKENRRLREAPDAEVPQEVRRACLKAINRAFRKKNTRTAGRTTVKILKTVALVALLGILILSIAFAAFPEFRAGTLNMIMDTFHDGVTFEISNTSPADWTTLEDLQPAWIPDGYELIEENSLAHSSWVRYRTKNGDRLNIDLSPNITVDTEGTEVEHIQICGLPAFLIDQTNTTGDKRGILKIVVVNESQGYVLSVVSQPYAINAPILIDREDIIRIAESIF